MEIVFCQVPAPKCTYGHGFICGLRAGECVYEGPH